MPIILPSTKVRIRYIKILKLGVYFLKSDLLSLSTILLSIQVNKKSFDLKVRNIGIVQKGKMTRQDRDVNQNMAQKHSK